MLRITKDGATTYQGELALWQHAADLTPAERFQVERLATRDRVTHGPHVIERAWCEVCEADATCWILTPGRRLDDWRAEAVCEECADTTPDGVPVLECDECGERIRDLSTAEACAECTAMLVEARMDAAP